MNVMNECKLSNKALIKLLQFANGQLQWSVATHCGIAWGIAHYSDYSTVTVAKSNFKFGYLLAMPHNGGQHKLQLKKISPLCGRSTVVHSGRLFCTMLQ